MNLEHIRCQNVYNLTFIQRLAFKYLSSKTQTTLRYNKVIPKADPHLYNLVKNFRNT